MAGKVVIKKCKEYDLDEIKKQVESGLDLLGGLGNFIKDNDKVLLKVNCLFPSEPEKAVTTNPVFLKAVVQVLKKKTKNIIIGDSPGYGSFIGGGKKTGYAAVAREEGIELVDFKEDGEISNKDAVSYRSFKVTRYAGEVDKIINLPKLKTHGLMYMTLAVKNMFGIVAGTTKAGYHMRAGRDKIVFAQMLVDLYMSKPPALNIVDGIIGMEGNGPGGGDPVNTGVIVMGVDGFAVDHVVPQIVGLNPDRVYTNAVYRKNILKGKAIEVELLGEKLEEVLYRGFKAVPDAPVMRVNDINPLLKFMYSFAKDALTPKQIYIKEKCTGCLSCVKACPVEALVYAKAQKRIICDYNKCIRCFICQEICPEKAIVIKEPFLGRLINKK